MDRIFVLKGGWPSTSAPSLPTFSLRPAVDGFQPALDVRRVDQVSRFARDLTGEPDGKTPAFRADVHDPQSRPGRHDVEEDCLLPIFGQDETHRHRLPRRGRARPKNLPAKGCLRLGAFHRFDRQSASHERDKPAPLAAVGLHPQPLWSNSGSQSANVEIPLVNSLQTKCRVRSILRQDAFGFLDECRDPARISRPLGSRRSCRKKSHGDEDPS